MNWRHQIQRLQGSATFRAIMAMTFTTVLLFVSVRRGVAQQSPPLRMLLNLDLFAAPTPEPGSDATPGPSMLDQIQTLNQMGYLAGSGSNSAPASGDEPPVPPIPDAAPTPDAGLPPNAGPPANTEGVPQL